MVHRIDRLSSARRQAPRRRVSFRLTELWSTAPR